MTIEQRKIFLINWIIHQKNESVIQELEKFAHEEIEIPKKIIQLIEDSDRTTKKECIEHTSTKNILKNK